MSTMTAKWAVKSRIQTPLPATLRSIFKEVDTFDHGSFRGILDRHNESLPLPALRSWPTTDFPVDDD
jgi:hypothetical protein